MYSAPLRPHNKKGEANTTKFYYYLYATMAYINKLILLGKVIKDPEHKVLNNGKGLCILKLITVSKYKDKSGTKVEEKQLHRIKLFGPTADYANQTIRKDSYIYVEGSLEYHEYEDGKIVAEVRCRELTPMDNHKVVEE